MPCIHDGRRHKMKLCNKCDTEKPEAEFGKYPSGTIKAMCRKCSNGESSNFGFTESGTRVRLDEIDPYNQAIRVRQLLRMLA